MRMAEIKIFNTKMSIYQKYLPRNLMCISFSKINMQICINYKKKIAQKKCAILPR